MSTCLILMIWIVIMKVKGECQMSGIRKQGGTQPHGLGSIQWKKVS